jgi:DNA-binding MarR family transcriptional regulator/N-acetylglutamate synthase-like GNAT family acetyltransferase
MTERELEAYIAAVRHFNRFYTKRVGALDAGLNQSPFSLPEARLVWELAQRTESTATELCVGLGMDPGHASRLLSGLRRRGFVTQLTSPEDARRMMLRLTSRGQTAYRALDAAATTEIGGWLAPLRTETRDRLVSAMTVIESVLGEAVEAKMPYLLRPHRPGDMGWVVWRHGVLYSEQFGWDERFEALVAEIVAKFVAKLDAKRERCWIAERNGVNVGSVFLVKQSKTVARLRLLLVEPEARGLGIGTRLVEECIRFGRQAGYRKITLWTNDVLHAARRIYEAAGFQLVHSEPHHDFGEGLIGETWDLLL